MRWCGHANSIVSDEKQNTTINSSEAGEHSGYGLRENPRSLLGLRLQTKALGGVRFVAEISIFESYV